MSYVIIRPCRQTDSSGAHDFHAGEDGETYVTGPFTYQGDYGDPVTIFSSTHELAEATKYDKEDAEMLVKVKWGGTARIEEVV